MGISYDLRLRDLPSRSKAIGAQLGAVNRDGESRIGIVGPTLSPGLSRGRWRYRDRLKHVYSAVKPLIWIGRLQLITNFQSALADWRGCSSKSISAFDLWSVRQLSCGNEGPVCIADQIRSRNLEVCGQLPVPDLRPKQPIAGTIVNDVPLNKQHLAI